MTRKPIPQQFPPANTPFFSANNTLNPVWYRYFVNSFQREGGAQDDIYLLLIGLLTSSTQQGANTREFDSLSDAIATLQSLVYGRQDATAKIAAMEDELAALRAEILARKAYDGQIEELRVAVETLRLDATNLQQRQQAVVKSTESAINTAQTLGIGQAQTAFSQYTQLTASITGVADTVAGLTTTNIPEGTRLYYTDARARAALSATGTGLTYNNTTGLFTLSLGTAAQAATGTSGHTLPFLDGSNTFGGTQTMNNLTVTGTLSATVTGNAATATKLATARNIAITGDLAWNVNFDGSADVTAIGTLATVNANVGSFGSGTSVAAFTVNAKGLITAASSVAITSAPKWATARTLSFTGNVTGSGSVDGSADVATALTIANGVVTPAMLTTGGPSWTSGGSLTAGQSITYGTGGTYGAGVLYADSNWGVIFRAYTSAPALAHFSFVTGAGTEIARFDASGNFRPATTDTYSLGTSAVRFKGGYFSKPAVLPTYTVAGLPAAPSYTDGVVIATDLSGPFSVGNIVSGGGSNRGLVVSDGTNWRIG